MNRAGLLAAIAIWAPSLSFLSVTSGARAKDVFREEGEFKIYVGGKEIGSERYRLIVADDSASSSSVLDFRNPSDTRQKILLESRLVMDGRFRPRDYQLKSDVDGKKGSIVGAFSPNQVLFEYASSGTPRKSGVLVGNNYTILDTNIFHHFVFLVRLYKFDGKQKPQRFEVVIPQEADSGFLKIVELDRETILVGGKKKEARHLQVDSGSLTIHLWVDRQQLLHKITVPNLRIEVVRVS